MDPDHAFFIIDLKIAKKKLIKKMFMLITLKTNFYHFSKIKSPKN